MWSGVLAGNGCTLLFAPGTAADSGGSGDAAVADGGGSRSDAAATADAASPPDQSPPVTVRVTGDSAEEPDLVGAGGDFALAWSGGEDLTSEIFFVRLDADGQKLGPEVQVTHAPGASGSPSLAWTGGSFGVIWRDARSAAATGESHIYFAALDPSGAKIHQDVLVSAPRGVHGEPVLVWNGTEFAAAWQGGDDATRQNLYFRRINWDGTLLGEEVGFMAGSAESWSPALSWDGRRYSLAWRQGETESEVEVRQLNDLGETVAGPVSLGWTDDQSEPTLAGIRGDVAAVWQNPSTGGGLYYSRMRSLEESPPWAGPVADATEAQKPSMATWSGGLAVAWEDQRYEDVSDNVEIHYALLDAYGAPLATERLTFDPARSETPSVAWNGSSLAVAFSDRRADGHHIYFRRLSLPGE